MSDGYAPNPSEVLVFSDSGSGNMGDVTDRSSVARFTIDRSQFVLVFIRGHFSELGNGTADLKLRLDSILGEAHDLLLQVFVEKGVGNDLNFKIDRTEYEKWVFRIGDVLVLEWDNPDGTGALSWGVEVGLAIPE